MKVYIAIWEDRHIDTTAHAFSDKEKAIAWARKQANECCEFKGDYKETDYHGLFQVSYSCEYDRITVIESVIDKEISKG